MNESPTLKQMDHLLESKHGVSVPCLQSGFNDVNYSYYKKKKNTLSLQFTKGFIQKLVKIATSFTAFKKIIQFTK